MTTRDPEQDEQRGGEPPGEIARSSAAPPLGGIERVAQRVADQVEGQRQQRIAAPGKKTSQGAFRK